MIKSKLRYKVLKLRKSKSKKSININPGNIYSFLKKKNYNLKIIGGYYPVNYEINDLEILNYFSKKGSIISLPKIKKKNHGGVNSRALSIVASFILAESA